ncbi:MAG: ABC transporter ATP-binding protein [Phoenicibacter congonensis]|uniref:ABC transporter ATP-binding protein n=1 Tax=Phoenicibacter congonensis TaxID=1944646 RepID=A0AA43RKW3_9ACTN|nr:ABC transporter ATP-binding protein [Phoenicibacter congonensis]
MAEFLKVESLEKSYGQDDARVKVLRDISLSVGKGEFCVLLGPSGSGKSTFLNIIGGMETCDAGQIVVNGKDITAMKDKKLDEYRREELGFIFQFYNLVPDLTIRENIEVTRHISKHPLDIDELLKDLGLWEHRLKFPNQVSGGQQQRCAIGRALVKNPNLLLCDEPTGALDYSTSKEILELLEKVNKAYGTTILVVTHNEAIAEMANRILRLHDGKLVENTVVENPKTEAEVTW